MKTTNGPAPAKKAPLTHADLVDMFPILKGERAGFQKDAPPCIIDPHAFLAACRSHGSGADKCGRLVLSLTGHGGIVYGSLYDVIGSVDSIHKKAIRRAICAVLDRGVK